MDLFHMRAVAIGNTSMIRAVRFVESFDLTSMSIAYNQRVGVCVCCNEDAMYINLFLPSQTLWVTWKKAILTHSAHIYYTRCLSCCASTLATVGKLFEFIPVAYGCRSGFQSAREAPRQRIDNNPQADSHKHTNTQFQSECISGTVMDARDFMQTTYRVFPSVALTCTYNTFSFYRP